MQALILAGGKGTRLRPLTVYTPKPIVPICNRPFLLYQIDTLRRAGVTDITLSLSYQPEKIEQQLGDGSNFGVKLKYTVEPQPMGTAGAYKFAEDLIREPTVVFNGDVLTDLDLKSVIREHTERNALATVVLAPVPNPSAYGLVETEKDGRIRRFLEKPKEDEITTNNINAGTYVLKPGVKIVNSVLGKGCYIEERARIENSVLWSHTRVGTAAEVSGAVIGRGCYVGRSTMVRPGSILGDKTSLTDYTVTGGAVEKSEAERKR